MIFIIYDKDFYKFADSRKFRTRSFTSVSEGDSFAPGNFASGKTRGKFSSDVARRDISRQNCRSVRITGEKLIAAKFPVIILTVLVG